MLTIKDVLIVLKSKIKWIILSTILGVILAGGYTHLWVAPEYSSTASLYVINSQRISDNITTVELTTSQRLVKTYIVVLKSNTTMQQVSEKLEKMGYSMTPSEILGMISCAAINDTEAFSITATCSDPELARTIVTIFLQVLPGEIMRVVDAGEVKIIDEASYPSAPYYPLNKNLLIGAIIGIGVAVAIILLNAVFDTKVHGEERIREIFQIPIIGRVPSYDDLVIDRNKA